MLGHPNRAIHCDADDLLLDNHLCSLSLPMNEVTVVQGDGGGSCPRELTSGDERWLQAHGWVEITCGRSSCTVTCPGQPGGEGTDQKKMQKCL